MPPRRADVETPPANEPPPLVIVGACMACGSPFAQVTVDAPGWREAESWLWLASREHMATCRARQPAAEPAKP